jgi:acyl-lipid omega-6 desaturase (Delta-12 desaturase)
VRIDDPSLGAVDHPLDDAFLQSAYRAEVRMSVTETGSAVRSARDWAKALVVYRRPSAARGIFELIVTFPPFVAVWAAMLLASSHGLFWLSFALAPLAAGLLIRLFLIQHDCGHGSFFPNKHANDWVGRALGVLTVTPYDLWRRSHAIHHASSGNLDRRGIGDIKTLTVREYFARDWRGRLIYRLYRHPLVMFGLGPAYTFLIESRLPFGFMRKGPMPWVSTMTTNAGIAVAAGLLILCMGFTTFVIVHVPIVVLAATMGVWLFYVQHQFEATTWDEATDWSQPEAALHGSSHYDLPLPLRWFSANIGVHHVHHLSSGVPFYRLPEILRKYPELREVGRLTLWQSFVCVRLVLWDEETRRMLSFREARAARRLQAG